MGKKKTLVPPVAPNGKESITGGKSEQLPIKIADEMLPKLQGAYAELVEHGRQFEMLRLKIEAQKQTFNAVVFRHMLDSGIPKDYILDVDTWMFVKNGKQKGEGESGN